MTPYLKECFFKFYSTSITAINKSNALREFQDNRKTAKGAVRKKTPEKVKLKLENRKEQHQSIRLGLCLLGSQVAQSVKRQTLGIEGRGSKPALGTR